MALDLLPPDEIHLWLASTEEIYDAALLERYRTFLMPEERARELRFYFERDRRSYLLTRALVRTTLSRYLDVSAGQWQFEVGPFGKPRVVGPHPDCGTLEINISHSMGITVFALAAGRPLGIDVENRTRRAVSVGIADSYFAATEVRALRALPEAQQPDAFFDWWTLKEAYIKAIGKGLQVPLSAFAFDLDEPGRIRMHVDASLNDRAGNWDCWQFDLSPVHTAAICARRLSDREPRLVMRQVVPLVEARELDTIQIRRRSAYD
jgi:4'-phosphopantetheinyl transferase